MSSPARCEIVDPGSLGALCTKAATKRVTFGDGSTARACEPCAMRLRELAQTLGTSVRLEAVGLS